MWKREEPAEPSPPPDVSAAPPDAPRPASGGSNVIIGKSIVVKGELRGSEDLTIEGQVEGKIALKQHVLTIGKHGRIQAQVFAKSVIVIGEVVGNIEATEKVAIRNEGAVEGDIKAPRVAIAEGAKFRGGIDMQQGQAEAKAPAPAGNRNRTAPKPGPEPRRPAPAAKTRSA